MTSDVKPGVGPDSAPHTRDSTTESRELVELVNYLQTMYETERSTLAKELHDELGGLITAAKMDMQWLTGHMGGSLDAPAQDKFRSVVQMLNQAMMLKRRVVETLRPSLLDHFGLPVALRSHFEENCGVAGLECVASLPEESLELPSTTQLALFRIAQAALAGVITRATAKNVELVVEATDDGYTMLIGDDGAVADPAVSRALHAMRYRVESAGGSLTAEQSPGQGNRIRVYVPRSPAKSG